MQRVADLANNTCSVLVFCFNLCYTDSDTEVGLFRVCKTQWSNFFFFLWFQFDFLETSTILFCNFKGFLVDLVLLYFLWDKHDNKFTDINFLKSLNS